MTAEIAWDYGTRVWRQRLQSDGPGWQLVRRIQESRTDDAGKRERSAQRALRVEPDAKVRLLPPAHTDDGTVYALTASEVLASKLWPELRVVGRELESVMTALGATVARLHADPGLPADVGGVWSPHLRRLRRHLDADPATYAGQVVALLRPSVVAQVRQWLEELPTSGVLCHGGFTLGSVFVDEGLRRIELPTGEELMFSTPELDLGWMLGELTEYEYQAGLRGIDGRAYAGARGWLVDGWASVTGTSPDAQQLDKVIALRSFLQLCDVAETTRSIEAAARNVLFMTYLVERVVFLGQVPTQRTSHDDRALA